MAEIKINALIGVKRFANDTKPYFASTDFEAQLKAVAGNELTVDVNSPGGSVVHGNQMIIAAERSAKKITYRLGAQAASMGYFLCLAEGAKIIASSSTLIMLHSVQGQATGSPEDLIAEAEVLKKFRETIANKLAARTGKTVDEVTAEFLTGGDHWFTAAEALELKLIDAIEEYEITALAIDVKTASYEEVVAAFVAEETTEVVAENSFLKKLTAYLDNKIGGIVRANAPQAALVEQLNYDEKYFYDSLISAEYRKVQAATEVMRYTTRPDLKTRANEVINNCTAEMTTLIKLVYGDGADVTAVTADAVKAVDAKVSEAFKTDVVAEIQTMVTAEVTAKDTEIATLKAKVATLEKKPGAKPSAPGKGGDDVNSLEKGERAVTVAEEHSQKMAEVDEFDFMTSRITE